jgi:hypothetical protein
VAPERRDQGDGPQPLGTDAGTDQVTPRRTVGERGEIRAAERSAQRAAALAATEGFHPLRIRPYVAEPHGKPGRPTLRRRITVIEDASATADPGLFRAPRPGREYAPAEEPRAVVPLVIRGRHRRRRRSVVLAAATVAASALAAGAVAVSGQMMGTQQGARDQALPDLSRSMPDVQLPHDSSPATASAGDPVVRRTAPATTSPAPTTAASTPVAPAAGTPTAGPVAAPSTGTDVTTAVTLAAPAPPTPTVPPVSTPVVAPPAIPPIVPPTAPVTTAPPVSPPIVRQPLRPSDPAPEVLKLGDSGPAVVDLQRDLTAAHTYHGPLDGVFSREVEMAVVAFQLWHHVDESPLGTYGPATRAALTRTLTDPD